MRRITKAMPPSGVWRLAGGRPVALATWEVGPAIVLVPTEQVLLLAVDLPFAAAAERRSGLPFAVEDRIAEPLDAVHVVLGAGLGPATWLAAVVDHPVMTAWVAALADAGLGHARLVADALVLPPPPPGSWNVMGDSGRIVARTDSGTGLAVPAAQFAALWAAGGSLPCTVFGAPLDLDLPMAQAADAPDLGTLATSPLDLRTGRYAAPPRALPPAVRRAAVAAGLGLLAHTLLLAADARAAETRAAARHMAAESLLRATLPGTPWSADVDRLLPGSGHDRLLPLLASAAAALEPVAGLTWTKVGWSAADHRLTLGVEGGDLGALQHAQAALAAAGLQPASGAVTAGEGRADGDIVVGGNDA